MANMVTSTPRKMESFATTLVTSTELLTSQSSSSWEAFLLAKINKLQDENSALKDQLSKVETRLATLEGKFATEARIQVTSPTPQLVSTVKDLVDTEVQTSRKK